MKRIPLTQGLFAIVDDEDYERLSANKWFAQKIQNTFYARRTEILANGNQRIISMHSKVINVPPGLMTDHADGNGLNNSRSNLRICTTSQNQMNSKKQKRKCSSKYKGVYWSKIRNRWVAQIWMNGNRQHIGCFIKEEDAAIAYDKKALEIFGEFARTNL